MFPSINTKIKTIDYLSTCSKFSVQLPYMDQPLNDTDSDLRMWTTKLGLLERLKQQGDHRRSKIQLPN